MSLVTVCDFCRSVVARTDRQLVDHGKVAEIAESRSPLKLDLRGVWRGKAFRLVGRVQYLHPAGGRWDEWYVAFPGEKWGWLSEAQGRFAILKHQKLIDSAALPHFEEFRAGQHVSLGRAGRFTVKEVGRSQVAAAEGELPFSPIRHAEHRFVDLEGPQGAFVTIEYGGEVPAVFIGEEVSLADLGLDEAILKSPVEIVVGALRLNCPHCGGPLSLAAPDEAQRVTCPNCGSLLDVQGQHLEYLTTLMPPDPALVIPLGTKGTLQGVEYQVIGYLRRSVTYDRTYYWQEYLLYAPRQGFRWLIDSDQHWSLGHAISLGDVTTENNQVTYQGRTFRLFQATEATVRQVWGEFYWKVKVGDVNPICDYIAPPYSLSLETTANSDGTTEIQATLAEYLPHQEVERAFGLKDLPRGWGVAPNQPNPVTSGLFVQWGLILLTVWVTSWIVGAIRGEAVDTGLTFGACLLMSILPLGSLLYSWNFEYQRWKDSEFNPYDSES